MEEGIFSRKAENLHRKKYIQIKGILDINLNLGKGHRLSQLYKIYKKFR
jgi:hypothetical protein